MFRKDIQIFRAISVLAVIVYHFNVQLLPYGYLGVDLFFVISGYLITKQLLKNAKDKNLKFSVFYFKRFKRIIPSLISSSLITILIGYYNISLEHFYELFRGLKYSILFIGNVFFAQIINYFSIDTKRNLIVNLWSLSVEEQFYIVFPFLIICALKIKKIKVSYFFILCFLISLISYSELFYTKLNLSRIFFTFENYIFYSPFTRSSQFLMGSIAATVSKKNLINHKVIKYISIGLLPTLFIFNFQSFNQIIISGIMFYLLIHETHIQNNIFNTALIHIGNISYSLYLFHQPVFAGIRNHNYYATRSSDNYIDLDNIYLVLLVLSTTYFVSLINYLLVEQTYRNVKKASLLNFKGVFFGFTLIIIPALQITMIPNIYSQDVSTNVISNLDINVKPGTNYLRNSQNELCIDKDNLSTACKFGEGNNEIYFLGDSTISSLVNGFINENNLEKYTIIEYTRSGCYPVINLCNFKDGSQFYEDIFSIKDSTVILGGIYPQDGIEDRYFSETLNRIIDNGNNVIIIGYIPSPKFDESMFYKKNGYYLRTNNLEHYLQEKTLNISLKNNINHLNITSRDNLSYVDVFDVLCDSQVCNYFDQNEFLFIDGSHLSYLGAKNVVEKSTFLYLLGKS